MLKRRLPALLGIVLAGNALALSAQAVSPAKPAPTRDFRYRYRVLGVYDDATGQPIEGADVIDLLSGLSAKTTRTGTVSLYFLPDSGSLVRLRKVGYEQVTLKVAISPADTFPLTVTLRPATQLATVTVTDSAPGYISPRLRDFEDRMRNHAGGYFIDANTLRKFDDRGQFPTFLEARMPGAVQVYHGAHVHIALASSKLSSTVLPCADWGPNGKCMFGSPRGCWVAVYVDGLPTYTHAPQQDAPDFASMQIANFAGVEFYPHNSSLPQEFSGMGPLDCGTLLLWTREK